MILSTHGNKCLNNASENVADTKQSALVADEQKSCKHSQYCSRNKEAVGQDLDIHTDIIGEKSVYPKHDNRDQRSYTKTSNIFS